MIRYLPVYLLGSYIGMYYPYLLLKNKYDNLSCLFIGLTLVISIPIVWHFIPIDSLNIFYSIMILVGLWLTFNCKHFVRNKKIFSCEFYIFALHATILIPLTSQIINAVLKDTILCGVHVVIIKLFQIFVIVLSCALIKTIFNYVLPRNINNALTGGR